MNNSTPIKIKGNVARLDERIPKKGVKRLTVLASIREENDKYEEEKKKVEERKEDKKEEEEELPFDMEAGKTRKSRKSKKYRKSNKNRKYRKSKKNKIYRK